MKRVVGILITALAIWVAVSIVPGLDFSGEWWAFLLVALILSVINSVVRPVVKLLSLPVVLLTLGLFLLVINALMLSLTVWLADPARLDLGLTSDGFFWSTFLGALVISIVQSVVNLFIDTD
ncbi:MAG: phage holin family protein [Acidimicrobiia bacterium]